jgi:hypothetical protein
MFELLDQLSLAPEIEQPAGSKSLPYQRWRLPLATDSAISQHSFAPKLLAVGAANTIGPVADPTGPVHFSGGLTTQAEPGKFRRGNLAHPWPDLHEVKLPGIHHPVYGRATNPGGFAKLTNTDADACDGLARSRSVPFLSDWRMFDKHWEPPLSGRLPLFHKISL